ncbi:MAG TPA: M6 family metalloprotease domain-containing protein, partial [bacterium]|nr:M6 family metalloprotease domain-containing protein [bacterium]
NFLATVTGNAGGGDWLDVTTIDSGNTYAYFCNGASGMGAYPQNSQGLVEYVTRAIDNRVDFSQFDMDHDGYVDGVAIVFAGDADGSLDKFWPHAWALNEHEYMTGDGVKVNSYYISRELEPSNTAEIGVHCHEYGHVLGLPDLYDYTYTSYGVGNYDLMAMGNYLGAVPSRQPAQLSAWSKKQLGWLSPTTATFGMQTLAQVENTAAALQVPLTLNNTTEYFLIENRQKTGFDALLPGTGLLIYHVDEAVYAANPSRPNDNRSHKTVDVECADGLDSSGFDHLDRMDNDGDALDYWYAGNKMLFDGTSNPNTNMYDGHASGISVSEISASGGLMTFKLLTPFANQMGNRSAVAYPNPFNLAISNTVRIRTQPVSEARRIRICNLRGMQVREFGQNEIGEDGIVDWDGSTDNGGKVASGTYLLIITDISGNETIGHFTLVR